MPDPKLASANTASDHPGDPELADAGDIRRKLHEQRDPAIHQNPSCEPSKQLPNSRQGLLEMLFISRVQTNPLVRQKAD